MGKLAMLVVCGFLTKVGEGLGEYAANKLVEFLDGKQNGKG